MANADIYNEELDRLKTDSLETAHLRLGSELFKTLEVRGRDITSRITKKIREKKPNQEAVNDDERVAIREAQKKVDITKGICQMIEIYGKSILTIRDKYYMEVMNEFAGPVWKKAGQAFVAVKVKFTNAELRTLPRVVNNNDLRVVLTNLKFRTIATMNSTINRAYRDVPKLKQDAKTIYLDQFKANMRGLQRSFVGILNDLLVSTYETAKTRFTAAQRQFFEPQRA